MIPIKLIIATRESEENFLNRTATGRSLSIFRFPFLEVRLFAENRRPLTQVYNQAIDEYRSTPCILVFAHDDLHILDYYWADQIINGLMKFQIIGLAGNRRRVPGQPSWAFIDHNMTWDTPDNLSGVVGHGRGFPPQQLSVYGPPCQPVKLLDGVLLATHIDTLNTQGIRFDEQFDFHFYDLDLCRQAEIKGIICGTWMLSVIHESGGSFGSPSWLGNYKRYLEKWGG